jgi:hypothetical protein
MADNDHGDGDGDELATGLRDAGITTAGALIGAAIGGPMGAAAGAGLGELTKLVLAKKATHRKQREVLATAHIAWGLNLPQGTGARQKALAGIMADQTSADTIVQSFQRMVDATSSSAWPCIAVLTGDYVREGKPVDGFFRDATSLLAELDDEGLAAVLLLLDVLEPPGVDSEGRVVELGYHDRRSNVSVNESPPRPDAPTNLTPPAGFPRASRVLDAYGFASMEAARGGRSLDLTVGIADYHDRCKRLLDCMRRAAGPPHLVSALDPTPQRRSK